MGGTLAEQKAKKVGSWKTIISAIVLAAVMVTLPLGLITNPDRAKEILPIIAGVIGTVGTFYVLFRYVFGLQQESLDYAHNISRRDAKSVLTVRPVRISVIQ